MTDDIEAKIKADLELRGVETNAEEVQKEEVREDKETQTETVLSEVEQEAIDKGWSPEGVKSAEEYLRAEPLYGEIKARGKEIKELKETVDRLTAHMDKQQQQAYQQALEDLQYMRSEAIELGDVNEVDRVEQEMHKMQQAAVTPVSPKVQSFMDNNKSWLEEQSDEAADMRLMAEAKYVVLKNQGLADEAIVEQVEKSIRHAFPARFETKKTAPSPVEAPAKEANRASAKKGKYSFSDLNDEQKKTYRYFERHKVMSGSDYIKELVKLGEL